MMFVPSQVATAMGMESLPLSLRMPLTEYPALKANASVSESQKKMNVPAPSLDRSLLPPAKLTVRPLNVLKTPAFTVTWSDERSESTLRPLMWPKPRRVLLTLTGK